MAPRMTELPTGKIDTQATEDGIDAHAILGHIPLGVIVCELDAARGHPIHLVNPVAARVLCLPGQEPPYPPLEEVPVLEFGEPLLSEFKRAADSGRTIAEEWTLETSHGQRHYACDIVPLKASEGTRGPRVLCTLFDRTSEKQAETKLLHHALHDALTGLPNRNLFINRLEEAVARARSEECPQHCAALIVNIDRFQLINESFGHQAGDSFLIEIAEALRSCLRSGDVLARFSADEFAILMPDLNDPADTEALAARIHALMDEPRWLGETEILLSVSIGIATTLTSRCFPEDLIRDADVAMHRAKQIGRARTEIYRRDRESRPAGQIETEAALRRAIDTGALEMFYQPIVDLETGGLIAFEALARWHHPERGFIEPKSFIAMAEDSGLIVPLGRWAIHTATRQLTAWQATYPDLAPLRMNINLSPVQILRDDAAAAVEAGLAESGLRAEQLRLEITEGALIADPEGAARTLQRIKNLGASLALDDFGTGYSSLSYLHTYPIDCLKIDQSFVGRAERDESAYKIMRTITMMAQALDMSVIAEGIESEAQCAQVRRIGCRYGQGFLFARPLPREDAERFLHR